MMQPIVLLIKLWVVLGWLPLCRGFGIPTDERGAARRSLSPLCNGHAELCSRRYSNVTYVTAHNSPFNQFGNPGSNQAASIETQLDDGVRMLQFQTHFENNELRLCHTSCKILDAGLLVDLLRKLRVWLANHPDEVVTVLMGNDNFIDVGNYTGPMVESGLVDYVYRPPAANMDLDAWPTLGEMIQNNSRVVVMLDYKANFTHVPYIVDEFLVMWETKFSPTDPAFPCTPERPPHQSDEVRRSKMMLMNHNLNQNFSVGDIEILVPYWTKLDSTNADHGNGSVGDAVRHCETAWSRPFNFLLVDYYKDGNYPGSVFGVAAKANGLTYAHSNGSGQVTGRITDVMLVYLGSVLIWMLVLG